MRGPVVHRQHRIFRNAVADPLTAAAGAGGKPDPVAAPVTTSAAAGTATRAAIAQIAENCYIPAPEMVLP